MAKQALELVIKNDNKEVWLVFKNGALCINNLVGDLGPITGRALAAAINEFLAAPPDDVGGTLVGTIDVSSEGVDGIEWKNIEPGLYHVTTIPAPSAA